MTTRETADLIAENPYVKFIARLMMVIALPFIYWITSQTVTTVTTLGAIVQIQQQLQQQVNGITQTENQLLNVAATEAQSRSTRDAAFEVDIENLKQESARIDAHLSHTDDRLNSLMASPVLRR